jgi:hypothetical protein
VFQRGYDHLKSQELKEERLLLLEAWRAVEKEKGDAQGKLVCRYRRMAPTLTTYLPYQSITITIPHHHLPTFTHRPIPKSLLPHPTLTNPSPNTTKTK